MKIIVSILKMAENIKKAFDVDAHCIQYFANGGTLVFGTKVYQADVSMGVEKQFKDRNETVRFNNLAMAKLLFFLKNIQHQPVTITLEDDTVTVEHAVIDFA